MPLLLAFVLIGFFIWLAENISTFFWGLEIPEPNGRLGGRSLRQMEFVVLARHHDLHDRS